MNSTVLRYLFCESQLGGAPQHEMTTTPKIANVCAPSGSIAERVRHVKLHMTHPRMERTYVSPKALACPLIY